MFLKSILFGSAVLWSSVIRFISEDYLIEKNTEKTNKKETFSVVEKSNEQDIVYQDFLEKIENLNKNIKLFKVKNLNMLEKLKVLKTQLEINNKHKESVIVEKQAKIDACKDEIERIKRKITSNEESIKSSIISNLEKKDVLDDELIKLQTIQTEHKLKTNKKDHLNEQVKNKNLEKTELLKKITDLEKVIKQFKNKLIPIKNEYQENKDKIAKFSKEEKTLQNANEKLNLQKQLNKEKIEDFKFEITKAAREIVIKTEVYNALKIESDLIDAKLNKTIADEKKEKLKVPSLTETQNDLKRKKTNLEETIKTLKTCESNIKNELKSLEAQIFTINQSLQTKQQENTQIEIANQELLNNQRFISSNLSDSQTRKEELEKNIKNLNLRGEENKESLKTTEANNFNQSITNIQSEIEALKENSKKLIEEKSKLTEEKTKIEQLIQEYKEEIKNNLSNNDLTKKYESQQSLIPKFEYDLNEINYFILLSEAKLGNDPNKKAKFEKLKSLFKLLKNDHDFLNESIMILKNKYVDLLKKINSTAGDAKYVPQQDEKESILQSINSADIFSKAFKEKLNQIKTELTEFEDYFTIEGEKIQFDFEFIKTEILGLEEDQKKWEKFKEEFEIETQEYDDLFDMATLFKKIVNKKQKQVIEIEAKIPEVENVSDSAGEDNTETTLSQNFDLWYEKLFALRSDLTAARNEYSNSMIKFFTELFLLESADYVLELRIKNHIQNIVQRIKKIKTVSFLTSNLSSRGKSLKIKIIKVDNSRIYLLNFSNTYISNPETIFVQSELKNFRSYSKTEESKNMQFYSFNISATILFGLIFSDQPIQNNTNNNIKIGVAKNCQKFSEFQANINKLKANSDLVKEKRKLLIEHLTSHSNNSEVFTKNELSIIHQIEADKLEKMWW